MAVGNATLQAGAGRADITPEPGILIAGDISHRRPTEEVRDPLYARAICFESGGERFCILTMDLLLISNPFADEIRRRAGEQFGIDPKAIAVHPLQNHAAPALGAIAVSEDVPLRAEDEWLRMDDKRYHQPAVDGALSAIGRAVESLQPVTVRAGRGVDGRVAFNRRFVMRDGTVQRHPPPGHPDILHIEGPADPEVGVVTLTGADGACVAAMLHHTCHPTHGFGHRYVTAGWPGAWCDQAGELLGQRCTPLVINGACGNTHHTNHLDPNPENDSRGMAAKLTQTTARALEIAEDISPAPLKWTSRTVRLPRRPIPPEILESSRRLLAEHPEPMWQEGLAGERVQRPWMYALAVMKLQEELEAGGVFDYEIQAMRIGELAVLIWMGEPYVEAQLAVKAASPAQYTLVSHMSNGYAGYIPTKRAFSRRDNCPETHPSVGSKLAVGALDILQRESIAVLHELFED